METLRFLTISTHFPPHYLGGDAVFVEYPSKELVRRGHEVHVFHDPAICKLPRNANPAMPRTEGELDAIRHQSSSSLGQYEPIMALTLGRWGRAGSKLTELERDLNPDVIHWHNTKGFIGKPFPFPRRVSLHTSHDYMPACPRLNLLKPGMNLCKDPKWCAACCMRWGRPPQLWRMGRRRVLRFDDELRVISPSEFLANRLKSEGIPVHKVLPLFVPDIGGNLPVTPHERDTLIYLGYL